jgi:hypothetical protein
MTRTCPGTVAAGFAKADALSLPFLSADGSARDLRRDGRSTTSEDKQLRMSAHA